MGRDVRLFLDSNVILSGLFSSKGAPRIILDLLSFEVPHLRGLTGRYNLEEVERNLKKRFPSLLPAYREYLGRISLETIDIPPFKVVSPLLNEMSPKDAPVLASALLGRADYLITGDKKGFPKRVAHPILVVTSTDFIEKTLPSLVQEFTAGEKS